MPRFSLGEPPWPSTACRKGVLFWDGFSPVFVRSWDAGLHGLTRTSPLVSHKQPHSENNFLIKRFIELIRTSKIQRQDEKKPRPGNWRRLLADVSNHRGQLGRKIRSQRTPRLLPSIQDDIGTASAAARSLASPSAMKRAANTIAPIAKSLPCAPIMASDIFAS
jgi:hypothetical protein